MRAAGQRGSDATEDMTAGNFTIKNFPHAARKWLVGYARRHGVTMAEAAGAAVEALRDKEARITMIAPAAQELVVHPGHADQPPPEQKFRDTRRKLVLVQQMLRIYQDIGESDTSELAEIIRQGLVRELKRAGLRPGRSRTAAVVVDTSH